MRIASLVPSATETLFALGLGESVAAVTHECDYPAEAERLPNLTRSVIAPGLEPAALDRAVRETTAAGGALYELDEEALAALEVDLIVTQALCAVCAVSFDEVRAVAGRLPSRPRVLSLDPETLSEVLASVQTLARAAGVIAVGDAVRAELEARLDSVRRRVAVAAAPASGPGPTRTSGAATNAAPRVAALEWLDPPYVAGHWVPEMVGLAGGIDVLGEPGGRSRTASWEEIAAAQPDVVVAMPCGLYAAEAAEQVIASSEAILAVGAARVFAVDAASSYSRPGPRLVDGTELLAHLLHPDLAPPPPGLHWHELTDQIAAP